MIMDPIYWLIILVFMILSSIVGAILRKKFEEFSEVPVPYNLTGAEVAQLMLKANGINDVKIVQGAGYLTDHYNPLTKTITLSEPVYGESNIAAAAVAAHETGHAIQHARKYPWLYMRSALVPVLNVASSLMQIIFIAALFFGLTQKSLEIALGIIVGTYGLFMLFSLITLPVEIDASRRALKWLEGSNIARGETYEKARTALKWAAYTYVIAFMASLAQFLYWLMIFISARNRDRS